MNRLKLNSQRGITLFQLLVTIIIMIIIASFAIWYAANTSSETKLTRIYSEITTVKESYDSAKVLNELNPGAYDFESLAVTKSDLNSEYETEDVRFLSQISNESDIYLITPDNAKELEIEKLTMDYVIDGETGNVYLVGGYSRKNDNNIVYEQKEIVRLYKSTFE